MAGHLPFLGRGLRYGNARNVYEAFFEAHGLNEELQEKYYKWWYDWARDFVLNDPDLKVTKGILFNDYPLGHHPHHDFHLKNKRWALYMVDLGDLLRDVIWPKLNDETRKKLEKAHEEFLHELEAEAKANPRPPAPEVGYFRHT